MARFVMEAPARSRLCQPQRDRLPAVAAAISLAYGAHASDEENRWDVGNLIG